VSARPRPGGARQAGLAFGPRLLALVALGVLALAVFTAAAAGCGVSGSSDISSYLGVWQRVDGGAPNPDVTLTVAAQGDGAALTLVDQGNAQSQTVAATVGDGYLACTLPSSDGTAPTPVSGVPAESDLQLSVGEGGQLVVDLVLADGTTEPIWIYERAAPLASSTAAEP
jgi:hypothetical protein